MNIKFTQNGNFVGTQHSMIIDDKEIFFGVVTNEDEVKPEMVKYLKEHYDIDYPIDDIKFVWGGRL